MGNVFLCHANEQRDLIECLAAELEAQGIPCWYAPRNVVGDWTSSVTNAIDDSAVVALVASTTALTSPWVTSEVYYARDQGKTIVPLVLPGTELSSARELRFILAAAHQLKVAPDPGDPVSFVPIVRALTHAMTLHASPGTLEVASAVNASLEANDDLDALDLDKSETPIRERRRAHPYSARVTQASPLYICILVDCSNSMNHRISGIERSKKALVAETINGLLMSLAHEARKVDGYAEYFFVSVIGYGTGPTGGETTSLLPAERLSIKELMELETEIEEVSMTRRRADDSTEHYTRRQKRWVAPKAIRHGNTVMQRAFEHCVPLVKEWVDLHPSAFPPIVMNLSDGGWTGENPTDTVRALQEITSNDGNTLVFNCQVTNSTVDGKLLRATYPGEPPTDQISVSAMFQMSSVLPVSMREEAEVRGYDVVEQSRGFVLNADARSLVDFLEIGTRTGVTA